jgi:hypothetical protein
MVSSAKGNKKVLSGLELSFVFAISLLFFPLGLGTSQGQMATSTVGLLAVVVSVDLVHSVHLIQRCEVDWSCVAFQ